MTYTCPPGYNLQIDLDANTQWCQGEKGINDIRPAQPKAQAMSVVGVSTVVAGALVLAAIGVSVARQSAPKRRKQGRRR
jgi:hypothetical protein